LIRTPHWGAWATVAWGVAIYVVFVVLQTITIAVAAFRRTPELPRSQFPEAFESFTKDGYFISLVTFATAIVCGGLVVGIVKLKRGASLREYLAMRTVPAKALLKWAAALAVLLTLFDVTSTLLGRPIVPQFMRDAYMTAVPVWLFWLAVVVAAPLFEEIFFRGFLLTGLESSVLRPAGAVIATAALWASIHTQYDLYEMTFIFVLGILFGAARVTTGSLLVPVVLHALTNLGATVETMLVSG
jgi:uncharacterized protein